VTTASKVFGGAESRGNLLFFDPLKLKLITDERHHLWDPRVHAPVDPHVVASIMLKGVINPILVERDKETDDICVVNGRQRVKAIREANVQLLKAGRPALTIAAVVVKGDMMGSAATMALANEGVLAPTPTDRAMRAKQLMALGYTEAQTAVILCVSPNGLKNYLSLLEGTAELQAAVKSGAVQATLAYGLAKLPPEKQRAKLGKMLEAAPSAASETKRGKAKAQRAAVGDVTMRRRGEIGSKLEELEGKLAEKGGEGLAGEVAALKWVLGQRETLR